MVFIETVHTLVWFWLLESVLGGLSVHRNRMNLPNQLVMQKIEGEESDTSR